MKAIMLFSILAILAGLGVGLQFSWTHAAAKKGEEGFMSKDLSQLARATFAGGCFWCVEADFEKVDGVVEVISGYTGGHKDDPTYEEVSAGGTGHVEAVQVFYDPKRISYKELPTRKGNSLTEGNNTGPPFFTRMRKRGSWQRIPKSS